MRNKATSVINVIPPTTDYPLGRIKNNDGTGNGTPIVEELYGDMIEFFTKLFSLAGITMNDMPDNETNGYQSIQALYEFASKHNIVKDCEFTGDTLVVNQMISNMNIGELIIQRFNAGSNSYMPTNAVNKIKFATESTTFLLHFPEDRLYNSDLVLIEKTASGFTCSTLAEGRVLNGLRNFISQLQSRPTDQVIELPNKTIAGNPDSISFNSSSFIMDRLLSWEITWERYVSESGNTAIFVESNKQLNLTSGQAIDMVRFNSTPSGGFIRFTGMNGYVLNKVKLILKYKPDATINP